MVNYYNPDPRILSEIPQQAYEIIRQRIVEILGVELENQHVLSRNGLFETAIWMERTVPFADADLTPCVVNVLFDAGSYDNEFPGSSDGSYTYYIEIYSKAASNESQDGDELARVQAARLMGVVRQILMATTYKFLGMPPGSIMNRRVAGIKNYILDRSEQEENSIAVSRLTLEVKANEQEITERANPIQGAITTVLLSCTEYGYVFSRENIYNSDLLPDPCGCEFKVILFNSDEKPLYTITEDTGDSFVLPNVTVVDGQGVSQSYPYDPDQPIVTDLCPVICEAATVNVNGSLFNTVASGGTLNVPVRYEDGTPVGTINSGVVEIPDPITCADATAVLKDTDGNTLSTTNIASGATADITAPDADYELVNTAATVLETGSILSGGSAQIEAPNGHAHIKKQDDGTLVNLFPPSGATVEYIVADSTITLEDTVGNELSVTDVHATESETIVAPDGSVTVNGSAFNSVLSGGSLDVPVEYENGTPVGTITDGVVVIPDPETDLILRVNFESGAPLSFDVTIDSDTAGTYTDDSSSSLSATYEINSSPATLPFSVVATDVLTITVASDNGYVKLTGAY